jgi:hypothetical protein
MRTPFRLLIGVAAVLLSACGAREQVSYYPTGEVAYRVPVNWQGLREGEGHSFYRNGQLKSSTPFYKDRVTGVVRWYYPTGQLQSEEYFKSGEPFGPITQYYPTGHVKHRATRYGRVYADTTRSYHPNGELRQLIVYDGRGRRVDFGLWRPNGEIDAAYGRPFFLSDRDTVPEGQDYTFEAVLGARRSNVVNVKVRHPRTGVDSTTGTYSRTRYLVRRPARGRHTVTVQLYNYWARKGSDTIWTIESIPISKSFWVTPNRNKK